MCIGIPSRVLSVNGQLACVDSFGQQREVSLLLLDEPVNVGDYLLVQVGGFAASRMSAEDAEASLSAMQALLNGDLPDDLIADADLPSGMRYSEVSK